MTEKIIANKKKKILNKIILRIQHEKNITRTSALYFLAAEYRLSYDTIHRLTKHGQMPKRQTSINTIDKLLKEKK